MVVNPKLTYGVGLQDDCDDTSIYTETETGLVATLATDGDTFTIEGTCDNAADEEAYYERAVTPNLDTDITTKIKTGWYTSVGDGVDGLDAFVELYFTDTTTQKITLGKSTTYTVTTTTITANKTLSKLRFGATDNPDSLATGTYQVYFDFALLYEDDWEIPFAHVVGLGAQLRLAQIEIPGRVGDVIQVLGMKSPTLRLSGKIDIGPATTWGTPLLDYIVRILHECGSGTAAWEWLETGASTDTEAFMNCKVVPRNFKMELNRDSGAYRTWSLDLVKLNLRGETDYHRWLGI